MQDHCCLDTENKHRENIFFKKNLFPQCMLLDSIMRWKISLPYSP